MARGTIIALVGIDGAGKSTSAVLVVQALRARGQRVRAFENPGGRPVLDGLARRFGRADGGELLGADGRVLAEVVIRSAALLRAVAWARVTGGTAVMDRYAICQLATMQARGDRGQGVVRRWQRLFPWPDRLLWLVIDPVVAQRRVAERGRDTERIDWLVAFHGAYDQLVAAADRVDATASEAILAAALD